GELVELVAGRLGGAGGRVLTARDGMEALGCASAVRSQCIVLGLKKPRLGGFDALPDLRRALPSAHILVLTGSPNRPLGEACRARGADDFLLKPFEPGELLRRVARAFADGRS